MNKTDVGHGRGWLDAPAAASLRRIDAQIGHPFQTTYTGRLRAEQQRLYDLWRAGKGSYAAKPGTSPHEFGNAIDTNERLVAILAAHGWWRPLKSEPWHFVYRASHDKHRNDPAPTGGGASPDPEDEDNTMRNFITLNSQAAKFELRSNGTKRSISKGEWTAIRALERAGMPVHVAEVSQAVLDGIPGK